MLSFDSVFTNSEPPVERPNQLLKKDAAEGRPQALPTYQIAIKKQKKKMIKKS